jgi:Leucine-rich repeat (LRR) protein
MLTNLTAQDCRDKKKYEQAMLRADSSIRAGNYALAQDFYNAAKVYCKDENEKIDKTKDDLFVLINNLRQETENARNETQAALIETQKAKIKADSALQIEKKLTSLFYFSEKGIAPVFVKNGLYRVYDLNPTNDFKHSTAYLHGQNGISKIPYLFRFIDRQGNIIDELGGWSQAEPFLPPGFAKVQDYIGRTFLLTIDGDIYRYDYENFEKNEILILHFDIDNLIENSATKKDFYMNNLKLLKNFSECTNLKFLQINEGINIEEESKFLSKICRLKYLEVLNLSGFDVYYLPDEIDRLQYLKVLFLGHGETELSKNQLRNLPAGIGQLQRLESLNLEDNKLNTIPAELGNLQSLQILNLGNNELSLLPTEIGNLQNLQSLDLSVNQLSNLPAEIGQLKNLSLLDLSVNQLSNLPAEIGQLKNLSSLGLSVNQLSNLPAEIGNLQNLQSLDLSGNQLSSLPAEIGNLQNLQSLDLSGNQFYSLPIDVLKKMPNLKKLVLKDKWSGNPNPLHPSDIESLRRTLLWCEIILEE